MTVDTSFFSVFIYNDDDNDDNNQEEGDLSDLDFYGFKFHFRYKPTLKMRNKIVTHFSDPLSITRNEEKTRWKLSLSL